MTADAFVVAEMGHAPTRSADVLAITVPIEGRYPSVNNLGRDGLSRGRKTESYHRLFRAVKEAAEDEIKRTGWSTATSDCFVTAVRIIPDRRRADPSNMLKCEADALTKAGVWEDDRLANPPLLWIRHEPGGAHRIVIVVVKLHQSVTEGVMPNGRMFMRNKRRLSNPPTAHVTKPRVGAGLVTEQMLASWRPGDPIPRGYADYGGKLVTREFALEKMRNGK